MERLDIAGDARRIVDVVKQGGVAVFPTDVGYAGAAGCEAALTRFFLAKGRGAHKRNAMLGSIEIHEDVHTLPARANQMIRALVEDYDLPISAIGPFRADHPLLRPLGENALAASTEGGIGAAPPAAQNAWSRPRPASTFFLTMPRRIGIFSNFAIFSGGILA